ncbi:hypothetical protein SAMN05660772_01413 [Pasteurella testudinis DSM 23072]|uniref:YqjK-like protein n=1 Tax=Pasteurella testudinis DSM 23072 TaxID=1122938 RepID=A0A1W1V9C6_9PAST|nr:hypothetical protein [Pasteurella testudinis]SMB89810.1 hypothetical protein SAMN05660772_01413 [Pasteurella testudinis DSM 23072]SUB52095.1 Uncharacterised protein [Pasteurella testudinis]
MPSNSELEKELLLLKGEVLRNKFRLQTQKTQQDIRQPFRYLQAVSNPIIRSSLISLSTRLLLGRKWLLLPAIGVASFLLLKNQQNKRDDS